MFHLETAAQTRKDKRKKSIFKHEKGVGSVSSKKINVLFALKTLFVELVAFDSSSLLQKLERLILGSLLSDRIPWRAKPN